MEAEGEVINGEDSEKTRAPLRKRINAAAIKKYGPSPNCPRCRAHRDGNANYKNYNHTEICRARFYGLMEEHNNRKNVIPAPEAAEIRVDADADQPGAHAEPADSPPLTPEDEGLEDGNIIVDDDGPPMEEPSFDDIDQAVIDELMKDEGPESQYTMDVDLLLQLGCEPVDACRLANRPLRHDIHAISLMEAYGRGGLTDEATRSPLGIKGLGALDLACKKPNGDNWDFSRSADRREAMNLVEQCDPDWIVGSPPCTDFSLLDRGMNYPTIG